MSTARILFISSVLCFLSLMNTGAEPLEESIYLILPFENKSTTRSSYWIGEALADLISQTAEMQGVKVVQRRERIDTYATFGFSPLASPTLASQLKIAEQLQATHLIYGSFSSNDNLLHIQCALIDLQKLSIVNRCNLVTGINDLLAVKKIFCEKLFSGRKTLTFCTDALQMDYGDTITIQGYEAFIKASLEDSFAMKEELYGKALKLSPGFTRTLYEIALLYFSTSQFDAAEESLGLITDKRSKVGASACMLLGEIYLENGRFVQAIDVLKKAVSYGGTGKAHYLLSKAYYMAGDTGSASKELDISLKLDPSDIDARSFKKNLEQKK